jgi:hypothetical protein
MNKGIKIISMINKIGEATEVWALILIAIISVI